MDIFFFFDLKFPTPQTLGRARPSGKKSFFHLFPKILNIVLSTSTRSQNDGKYLYFTRLKIVLAEKNFLYRLRTFLCDESS